MHVIIDDAQQFIIGVLKEVKIKNQMHTNPFAWGGYDVHLSYVIPRYITLQNNLPNQRRPDSQEVEKLFMPFSEAAWNLCQKGILRLGKSQLSGGAMQQEVGVGFTITSYGHQWLERADISDLLPATPDRWVYAFDAFQSLFGSNYFRRAKEAVHCFQTGNFLACCTMCGAAAESILLAAAYRLEARETVLKKYHSSAGRSNVEKIVFKYASDHIKKMYLKYTDIMSYWRDESGHGGDSDIDKHEPYIALVTLLRFAEFMRDQWGALAKENIKELQLV